MTDTAQLADRILAGDRASLARGITLVESNASKHQAASQNLLARIMPHTGRSRRIGISGVPGVGKSTFIEAFGLFLCDELNQEIAVLAIDPSSSRTGGSILGDKTRMEMLSRHAHAFIRPSPSGGALGGVTRKTREAILLCEAAGCSVVIVETVGTGQNEITVRSMVDFFLVLMLPNAGDELQGIKKGIIELADALLINKADIDTAAASRALAEYQSALHSIAPPTQGWHAQIALVSALKNTGMRESWAIIDSFYAQLEARGVIARRRSEQNVQWMMDMVREAVLHDFFSQDASKRLLPDLQQQVAEGKIPARQAAASLFERLT